LVSLDISKITSGSANEYLLERVYSDRADEHLLCWYLVSNFRVELCLNI